MGKRILKFPEEGLKQLHFFMEGLSFPVAVAAYSEQDIGKLSYLIRCLQSGYIRSTYAICIWCILQGISYQILFHISVSDVIHNPIRVYDYLRLRGLLKKSKDHIQGRP